MTDTTVQDDSALDPEKQEQEPKATDAQPGQSDQVDEVDPDEAELEAARKAAETPPADAAPGEGDGKEPPPDAEGKDGKPASPGPAKDQGAKPNAGKAKPAADTPMIPKARFDEVNTELGSTKEQLAYWRGRAEAYGTKGDTTGQPGAEGAETQDPPDPYKERIATARQRVSEAAKKYDDGDMTLQEYEKIRGETDDEIFEARQEQSALAATSRTQQPTTAFSDEVILDNHAAKLEQDHPSLQHATDADIEALTDMARTHFKRIGKPIGVGPRDTMRLRQGVAILADRFIPVWNHEARAALAASKPSRTTSPGRKPAQQPNLSPDAKARLDKITAAQEHPPDTRNMGRSQGTKNEITEDDINRMSEDEIAALPAETRARFL
jgi:hypothetical protein